MIPRSMQLGPHLPLYLHRPEHSQELDMLSFPTDPQEITEFQRIADGFIHTVDNLAKEVEKEKIKAIGVRNLLKSVTKQREAEQQQCQVCTGLILFHSINHHIESLSYLLVHIHTLCSILAPALMIEKSMELERLRVQYQSLMKCEHEQQETIEQLTLAGDCEPFLQTFQFASLLIPYL
uniref:Uncharacterized protein n=1 Tax=Timema monikensis TaxID=170555 RepID=A0A7R9EJD4_9NEOP|nr:unnamed protein product [Timema monikensis]